MKPGTYKIAARFTDATEFARAAESAGVEFAKVYGFESTMSAAVRATFIGIITECGLFLSSCIGIGGVRYLTQKFAGPAVVSTAPLGIASERRGELVVLPPSAFTFDKTVEDRATILAMSGMAATCGAETYAYSIPQA